MSSRMNRGTLVALARCVLAGPGTSNVGRGNVYSTGLRSFSSSPSPSFTPSKLSAFTGKADFYEALFFLDDIIEKARPLGELKAADTQHGQQSTDESSNSKGDSKRKSDRSSNGNSSRNSSRNSNGNSNSNVTNSTSGSTGGRVEWLKQEQLSDRIGFGLSLLQYRRLVDRLNQLAVYAKEIPEIAEFLQGFSPQPIAQGYERKEHVDDNLSNNLNNRAGGPFTNTTDKENFDQLAGDDMSRLIKKSTGFVDQLGRVIAFGGRKSAKAKVYLVPGEGHFMVNGRPAHEYFSAKMIDMFRLAEPFRLTNTFNKYNVWGLVQGGGTTGQSGALCLAVSRALATHSEQLATTLNISGLLNRDRRRVERKKPGQPKARKKFTWVKR